MPQWLVKFLISKAIEILLKYLKNAKSDTKKAVKVAVNNMHSDNNVPFEKNHKHEFHMRDFD